MKKLSGEDKLSIESWGIVLGMWWTKKVPKALTLGYLMEKIACLPLTLNGFDKEI